MGQFITPPSIPPDTFVRRLCIPNSPEWVGTVTGALMDLIYSSEWVQTNGITTEAAANRAREMLDAYLQSGEVGECDSMACCQTAPMRYRINPDTGKFEQSNNGGATWGAAGGGVQSVIVEPIPPVTSGIAATKCDAASNVKEQVQVWIDQVSNDFTTATTLLEFGIAVLEAILAAVVVVLTTVALGPLEALVLPTIGAALFAAWGAGKAVFDAYWTTENKDKVFCAAYCHIGDDGSFSDAQFSGFWNEVNEKLPPSPAKMLFMGFLSSVGKEGLNAMAATGVSADSDCSDCDCVQNCLDDFQIAVFEGNNVGTIVSRTESYIDLRCEDVPGFGGAKFAIMTTPNDSACCQYKGFEILSGSEAIQLRGIECGSPRWPDGTVHNIAVDDVVNTIYFFADAVTVVRFSFVEPP